MNKLTNVSIKTFENSIYVRPQTMHYTQNGKEKTWDLMMVHDSVAVILYNITRKVLVFVKQFRPPVYLRNVEEADRKGVIDVKKYPAELGITIEMCAGIVDKNKPLDEIVAEEILEECGYKVPLTNIEKVASYHAGVGVFGAVQLLYYCEITDKMKVNDGGGIEDEIIDVIEMTIPEVEALIQQTHIPCPASFLFGIQWFFNKKLKGCF